MSDGYFAYRFEYADGSAFEIYLDGRAFIVYKDGQREEKTGKVINRIPELIKIGAEIALARQSLLTLADEMNEQRKSP